MRFWILSVLLLSFSSMCSGHSTAKADVSCVRFDITETDRREALGFLRSFEAGIGARQATAGPGEGAVDRALMTQTVRELEAALGGLPETHLSDLDFARVLAVLRGQALEGGEFWDILARWEKLAVMTSDVGTALHILLLSEQIATAHGNAEIPIEWRVTRICLLDHFLYRAPPSDWAGAQRLTEFAAWFVDWKVGAEAFPQAVRLDVQGRVLDWVMGRRDLGACALFLATDLLTGEKGEPYRAADRRLLEAVVTRAKRLAERQADGDCGTLDRALSQAALDAFQTGHIDHGDAMVLILLDLADAEPQDSAGQMRINDAIGRLHTVRSRVERIFGDGTTRTHSGD